MSHQFGVIVAEHGHGNTGDVGRCVVMATQAVWEVVLSWQRGRCGQVYCHGNVRGEGRCIVVTTWVVWAASRELWAGVLSWQYGMSGHCH